MPKYYPEHARLREVQQKSQAVHEFVYGLNEKGIFLAHRLVGSDTVYPINKNLTELVAEFFEIDLKKLEEEKLDMLEEMRKGSEV